MINKASMCLHRKLFCQEALHALYFINVKYDITVILVSVQSHEGALLMFKSSSMWDANCKAVQAAQIELLWLFWNGYQKKGNGRCGDVCLSLSTLE